MPRGSGKTSLCESACVWAAVYGHARFIVLIGAEATHALEMIESIKTDIETNELLGEDFPEVCVPVRKLEGITQRASGQLCEGKPTNIRWKGDAVEFPTVPGSPSSSCVIKVAGITGRIRGMKHKTPGGESIRPDLALVDDPQTDESARSVTQCEQRERILARAVLGLAGPGKKIAGLMPMTVVCEGDMADRVLDREKHPDWQATRTRLVYEFPTNEKLWAEYGELRAEGLRTGRGLRDATRFYRKHRSKMDEGAVVSWSDRFIPPGEGAHRDDGEISAIQHAMNLKLRDEAAFWAEYQNQPISPAEDAAEEDVLRDTQIMERLSGYKRGLVPTDATKLTCFVDVQGACFYWTVIAWDHAFTGWVVDYGTEPEQGVPYFSVRDVKRTLARAAPGAGREGAWYAGLQRFSERILARRFETDDGGEMVIDRCLVDVNWAPSKDTVMSFIRQERHPCAVIPAHGRYVGASRNSMMAAARKKGELVGLNWRYPPRSRGRSVRHLIFDTNWWKSFLHARLATAKGDPGSLTLFGASKADIIGHRMFAEQLTAEKPVRVEAKGQVVDEWQIKSVGRDNHFLDCAVGCAVAASMEGVSLPTTGGEARRKRQRPSRSWSQMQAEKRRRRSA